MERKHLLKRAVRDLLPESFFERRKMGFSAPLAVWFRGELRDYVEDVLARPTIESSGVFRYDAVRRILDDPLRPAGELRQPDLGALGVHALAVSLLG
jgi:asparagine synthase (glutamine-hydrolysing)